MSAGLSTHAHCQYVIVGFLQSGGARKEMPAQTVEDLCQLKCSVFSVCCISDSLAGKAGRLMVSGGRTVTAYRLAHRAYRAISFLLEVVRDGLPARLAASI